MEVLLKILLILLIIILAIILLLVLLGVFKIKYNFKITRNDKSFNYNININYLLKGIQVILDNSQKKHLQVKLFGIKLFNENKKDNQNNASENYQDVINDDEIVNEEIRKDKKSNLFDKIPKRKYFNLYKNGTNVITENTDSKESINDNADIIVKSQNEDYSKKSKQLLIQSKKASKIIKKERKPFNIKVFIHNTKTKFKYFTSKETHEFIKLLYKECKKILKFILPKKLNANLDIGLKDPFLLGTTLSFFSFIYKKFGDNLKITPHFNEKIFNGNICGEGEIRFIIIILIFIKLLFNRRFRQLIFSKKN